MNAEELIDKARAVWAFGRTRVGRGAPTQTRYGRGWYLEGSVSGLIRQTFRLTENRTPSDREVTILRNYLRNSGNLRAVEQLGGRQWRLFLAERFTAAIPVADEVPAAGERVPQPSGTMIVKEGVGEYYYDGPASLFAGDNDIGEVWLDDENAWLDDLIAGLNRRIVGDSAGDGRLEITVRWVPDE